MTKKQTRARVIKVYTEYINDPEKQIKEYKKLLKQAQEAADLYYIGFVFHMLAVAYNMLGSKDKMLINSVKSLAVFESTGDFEMIADAYITLGAAYYNQENYQLALSNYDKAYTIIKKHRMGGTSRLAVLNNLGAVYNLMGDYRSGIRCLSECLELSKKESPDESPELLVYYTNLAESCMHLGEYKKAETILKDAQALAEKVTVISYICDYRLKYAAANYNLGDIRQGNKNFDTAMKLAEGAPDTYSDIEIFRDLTRLLLKNGDRKRADKAVELLTEYGRNNSHTMVQLTVTGTLADYYREIGDTERAVEYYERLAKLYEARTRELKQVQLNIHKSLKDADASITRLRRQILESEERADKDHMTGLLNHAAMLRIGGEFIEAASKKKAKIGAVFIDIDCFKKCNDTYGHAKGDEIIKAVAKACLAQETDSVRFARYGGDEFLGLTCGLDDSAVADIARRICRTIRRAAIPNEGSPNGGIVTLSVGIVNVPVTHGTDSIIQIANYADKAVYYSKKAGKNCIHLLDHDRSDADGENDQFVRIEF